MERDLDLIRKLLLIQGGYANVDLPGPKMVLSPEGQEMADLLVNPAFSWVEAKEAAAVAGLEDASLPALFDWMKARFSREGEECRTQE